MKLLKIAKDLYEKERAQQNNNVLVIRSIPAGKICC